MSTDYRLTDVAKKVERLQEQVQCMNEELTDLQIDFHTQIPDNHKDNDMVSKPENKCDHPSSDEVKDKLQELFGKDARVIEVKPGSNIADVLKAAGLCDDEEKNQPLPPMPEDPTMSQINQRGRDLDEITNAMIQAIQREIREVASDETDEGYIFMHIAAKLRGGMRYIHEETGKFEVMDIIAKRQEERELSGCRKLEADLGFKV